MSASQSVFEYMAAYNQTIEIIHIVDGKDQPKILLVI